MKNILIIQAHPYKESFCYALAESYKKGALESKAQVELINLRDLDFNIILESGYSKRTDLEPDLVMMQEKITKADHLVFVYPNWWGTYPALLKGFIDRVFLPKYAFDASNKSPIPLKLLKGKSAHLIVTMDTPKWYYSLILKKSGHNSFKKSILHFCGIKPVKITSFQPIKNSTPEQREKWLQTIFELGKKN